MRTTNTYVRQYLEKIRGEARDAHQRAYNPRYSSQDRAVYYATYHTLDQVVRDLQIAVQRDSAR